VSLVHVTDGCRLTGTHGYCYTLPIHSLCADEIKLHVKTVVSHAPFCKLSDVAVLDTNVAACLRSRKPIHAL